MIIVCLTCNITLPRRRGSRPDGTRWISNHYQLLSVSIIIMLCNLYYNKFTNNVTSHDYYLEQVHLLLFCLLTFHLLVIHVLSLILI